MVNINKGLKIAVSGTYSSGKTTTTEALSLLTGIPRTHAKTSREILLEALPGKQVQELNGRELIQLGLLRLEERIANEEKVIGPFFSDGSVIHEWIYGQARMIVGINPSDGFIARNIKKIIGLPYKHFYQGYMDAYGVVVKTRAKRLYDAFVHLPVEFPLVGDNHRPVSEEFRALSDKILIDTLNELKIPYYVIGGSVKERLERIIEIFSLPMLMPIDEAIEKAKEKVANFLAVLESDARHHSHHRNKSFLRRLKYNLRN